MLFVSTHLVFTRPAPICRSKTLFSNLEFNMVSSSIWCSAPNKVVKKERLQLLLVWFGGHPSSPGFARRTPEAFFVLFSSNCGRFVLDALGDHSHTYVTTCPQHSGSTKDVPSARAHFVRFRKGCQARRFHHAPPQCHL